MTLEEIKIGETYYVRVKVTRKASDGNMFCVTVDPQGNGLSDNVFFRTEFHAFSPINAENGTKNTEPAPKYDPCRLFKKGDKVRVVECKGRNNSGVRTGKIGIVDGDEHPNDPETIEVVFDGDDLWGIEACYLELVTPVEELEPNFISEGVGIIEIWNQKNEVVKTWYYSAVKAGVEALAAAQAECDRLNAEYRKEMEK